MDFSPGSVLFSVGGVIPQSILVAKLASDVEASLHALLHRLRKVGPASGYFRKASQLFYVGAISQQRPKAH